MSIPLPVIFEKTKDPVIPAVDTDKDTLILPLETKCTLEIPYIDDSGSSYASSFLDESDATSLNHLLDDAASCELSINGLHDDQGCASCGYASLDASSSCEGLEDSLTRSCPSGNVLHEARNEGSLTSSCSSRTSDSNGVSHSSRSDRNFPCKRCIPALVIQDEAASSQIPLLTECSGKCDSPSSCSLTVPTASNGPTTSDDDMFSSDSLNGEKLAGKGAVSSILSIRKDSNFISTTPVIYHDVILANGEPVPDSPSRTTPKSSLSETPLLLVASTPNCLDDDSLSSNSGLSALSSSSDKTGHQAVTPHHYISSLRVASMRGTADMGGALATRVAAFLRTQYKSLVSSLTQLPWCPVFRFSIGEFETNVMQVPLSSTMRVPPGLLPISNIISPQKMAFIESKVEERPKRVLVEGEPGYEKSYVAFRLAYDWATDPAGSYLGNFSLVFLLTLRDFRGGSLFSYMCKEILPRHILSKEAMCTLWYHLRKIEEKVLFLLVGYDELLEEEAGDLLDLINGQLYPNSTVVLFSRHGACQPFPPVLHRRLLIAGHSKKQTEDFATKYFTLLRKANAEVVALSMIKTAEAKYSHLMSSPVMCLALCVLYEDYGGKLPSHITDLFMSLFKHMVRKNLLRRGEPMCYDVLPDKYTKLLQDFGKMALDGLKNNSPYFTGADLKTRCLYGLEVIDMGILMRMKSVSKLTKRDYYSPVYSALLEFLAAYYLSGLIHDVSLLQLEIDSLADKLEIWNSSSRPTIGFNILQFLVGLLTRNAHVIFNIVSQMNVPQKVLFSLLRESGMAQMNVLEVCKHVACREQVVIQTNSLELEEWGRLLYSPYCSLESIEVLLDFDIRAKDRHETFFTSLSFNESIRSVKLTCVVAGEFGEPEVTRLVSYVRAILTKHRLHSLEIQVTSLDESFGEVLCPVVDMICDTLPFHAQALSKLVLNLELESEQIVKLCEMLKCAPQLKVLHLPHLACGYDGLKSIAELISVNQLVSLNLSGSLSCGTPVDERTTACRSPSPQDEAPVLSFWSFTDAQGNVGSVFNSLPRSFYQSLPRRNRIESLDSEKHTLDNTILHKTSFPPPLCTPSAHQNGFHEIFLVFRQPSCHVCHLNISKCSLGGEDLVCLGETVRFSHCLSSLRLEGLSRMAEVIPILVALQDTTSLQLLDLSSPHVLLGDAALLVTLSALEKNKTLRFLVLNGWTVLLENECSLKELRSFLSRTKLQHLELTGCHVRMALSKGSLSRLSRQDDIASLLAAHARPVENHNLAFLKLDHFEVNLNNHVTLKGPHLLLLFHSLPKLVDLSLVSNLGSDVIDDRTTQRIFALIPSAFPSLKKLNIGGWIFSLDSCEKVFRCVGRHLRSSQMREVHLNGVEVREARGKPEMEHFLLQALTGHLHHLSLLSLVGLKLTATQATLFGKYVRDKLHTASLELETKGMGYPVIKAFRQVVLEGCRFQLEFLAGTTGTYLLKRVDRKEKMLGKWACVSTLEKSTEL